MYYFLKFYFLSKFLSLYKFEIGDEKEKIQLDLIIFRWFEFYEIETSITKIDFPHF